MTIPDQDPSVTSSRVLPEVCVRVHVDGPAEPVIGMNGSPQTPADPFGVLWTRNVVAGSPLAEHVAEARRIPAAHTGTTRWSYDPQAAQRTLRDNPASLGARFEPWNRACSDMTEHACTLLTAINQARSRPGGSLIWPAPIEMSDDSAGAILARARTGANEGRTTKSHPWICTDPLWTEVMSEFGLTGVASLPSVAMGAWWMAHLANDYQDWRQDYLSMLDYTFYFEYNVDTATFGRRRAEQILRDLNRLWDMDGLSAELQVRRLHMTSSMAFFDTKRKHEAILRRRPTDGLTAWVHRDRDWWRDFKAQDSGAWAHFLSFVEGEAGRDDMMLTGVTNDWVDLGPDLRNDECNQSVLAMTRGSVTTAALLQCYERSVWMINAQFTTDGTVRPDRYAACMGTIGTCFWEMCNHRHDLWRYYALAVGACAEAAARDLYKACQLADCYTSDLEPREPADTTSLTVPRRLLSYEVVVAGDRHTGQVALHTAVCDAVDSGVLPLDIVIYAYVVPTLLRDGKIASSDFLSYMDSAYCANFATVVRSGHACAFSDLYCRAIASLVMEQWWCGMYFAIGLGSLIEAQPGKTAGDRAHEVER
ncbi:hypothetical protein [Streptomyces alanosinicus]|uniref:hypothetical protein n=1 Tax=Streptomyces alanosinicus TaxID=68171 RepID=UPI001E652100|nr:hypothetical protein [Streptomyces alanosinicus]